MKRIITVALAAIALVTAVPAPAQTITGPKNGTCSTYVVQYDQNYNSRWIWRIEWESPFFPQNSGVTFATKEEAAWDASRNEIRWDANISGCTVPDYSLRCTTLRTSTGRYRWQMHSLSSDTAVAVSSGSWLKRVDALAAGRTWADRNSALVYGCYL